MTSTNIARATALRTAIDAIFVQPNKKTLKQHEALAVLAKVDGARNANVVTRTDGVREPTLGSLRPAWTAQLNAMRDVARRAIIAVASTKTSQANAAVAAILGTLDHGVREALLWQAASDDWLKLALLQLPDGERSLRPQDGSEAEFLRDEFEHHCRERIVDHIVAELVARHPGLGTQDSMPHFDFRVLISDLVAGANLDDATTGCFDERALDGITARQIVERIQMPGTWTVLPSGLPGCVDLDHDADELARSRETIEQALGMDTEAYLTTPHTDMTWVDLYLLAWVEYSMGMAGRYFEGVCNMKHDDRTFEFSFGT